MKSIPKLLRIRIIEKNEATYMQTYKQNEIHARRGISGNPPSIFMSISLSSVSLLMKQSTL